MISQVKGSSQKIVILPGDCSPCSLPFLYQGRLHFQCTTESPVKVGKTLKLYEKLFHMLCEGGGLCIHTSFPNPYGQILQNLLYIMRSFGHYSTMQGDLFGRCPTQSNLETGEASKDPAHWVGWCLHFDISNIFGQIRCDNTCPLQSYTPNDVIISKFEHLAKKFPQTAKMVEVGKNNPDVKVAFRLENPHWASV